MQQDNSNTPRFSEAFLYVQEYLCSIENNSTLPNHFIVDKIVVGKDRYETSKIHFKNSFTVVLLSKQIAFILSAILHKNDIIPTKESSLYGIYTPNFYINRAKTALENLIKELKK